MSGSYQHLTINKEPIKNDRRTRQMKIPRPERADIRAHGQYLSNNLANTIEYVRQSTPGPSLGSYFLKLNYVGALDFKNLSKHGVEFISQEDQQMCVVFADEKGLAIFADHLQKLGLDEADLTYKQILEALDGIDSWTTEDRVSWALKRHGYPDEEIFRLDVELWPVGVMEHLDRKSLLSAFEAWLESNRISVVDRVNLDSLLMYRLEVSKDQAILISEHSDVRLVDLIPTSGIGFKQLNRDINDIPDNVPSPAKDAAKICILDSGINTNHPLLKSAISESASFVEGNNEFDNFGHGTAVAGIVLYGDVEACDSGKLWQPSLWLCNGKVLDDHGEFDERIIERTLTEAVTYFSELGCKIFNLSLGNKNSPYDGKHIRGIAYVLDTLARQYDVLFIVSAGNFEGSEEPPVPKDSWRDEYPDYLLSEEAVIIDPAPALNVLTVGSIAKNNATIDEQRYPEISQLSPASENQPSPFTRHGPSVKGALKPELVAIGGNLANPMRQDGKQWKTDMRGLGVLTFNNKFSGNTLFTEISGTSFSAPYITHLAGRLLNEYPSASANLIRALLVNHANLPLECRTIFTEQEIKAYSKTNSRRELPREISGYGVVNEDALFRSSEEAVVLIADDFIENDSHHFFELPLPEDFLRSKRSFREIRVTLSYTPAVRTTRLDYKASRVTFNLVKGTSLEDVQKHFNKDTQNDNKKISDTSAQNRVVSSEMRSKGTVQSSVWELKQLSPKYKWFVVVTRQDQEWGKDLSREKEPFALVVTVTDHENEEAELYTQISQRIKEREKLRARS
jgi:subtilisin family serine protease